MRALLLLNNNKKNLLQIRSQAYFLNQLRNKKHIFLGFVCIVDKDRRDFFFFSIQCVRESFIQAHSVLLPSRIQHRLHYQ